MIDSYMMWIVFGIIVAVLLALDLGVFNRKSKHISVKKALLMTAFWIAISLLFAVFIYVEMGSDKAVEYLATYSVEKAMSIDNLFIFIVIFAYFRIPDEYQHKALFYGIVGALVFRALFIFAGAELLDNFKFVMYIFGAILIYTAIKTVVKKEDPNKANKFAMILSRHTRVSSGLDGDKLFTFKEGVRRMTPLMLCIIVIELTDIMFAVDSIPACLAITTDMFIVYTSNIFAILGLRSLYFALRGTMESLEYLKYGLGVILAFVGMKMLLSDIIEINVVTSLVVIVGVLLITIVFSLLKTKQNFKSKNLKE